MNWMRRVPRYGNVIEPAARPVCSPVHVLTWEVKPHRPPPAGQGTSDTRRVGWTHTQTGRSGQCTRVWDVGKGAYLERKHLPPGLGYGTLGLRGGIVPILNAYRPGQLIGLALGKKRGSLPATPSLFVAIRLTYRRRLSPVLNLR